MAKIRWEIVAETSEILNTQLEKLLGCNSNKIEEAIKEEMVKKGLTLTTAESCTGGHIASLLTTVPGASQYFLGGFVTYSNEFKQYVLGVPLDTLEQYGAVSEETAEAMTKGLLEKTTADYVLSISGIAGPTGGSQLKPVGTIWIAYGRRGEVLNTLHLQLKFGDRVTKIEASTKVALAHLLQKIKQG